jgi:tetratricopeptide (TPR) repeat protein
LAIIDQLIANEPKWGEAYFLRAVGLLQRGETELSRHALASALEFNPAQPEAHILQAKFYLQDKSPEQARQQAEEALILDHGNREAGILLGVSYLDENDVDKAIEKFSILAKIFPKDPEIMHYFGLAYLQNKNVDEAKAIFLQILDIDPGYSPALSSLVDISLGKNDMKGAYEWITRQLKIAPDNPEHYVLLSRLLLREKKNDEAIKQLLNARQLAPDNTDVIQVLASVYVVMGQDDKAIAGYRTLLTKKPDAVLPYMELAALLIKKGDKTGAQQVYRTLLTVRPTYGQAANNLAWLIADENGGDLNEAFRFAVMACQMQSGSPYPLDTLGWVYFKRADYDKALAEINTAVGIKADEPAFYYHLARIYQVKGEFYKAVELLRKALSIKSTFTEQKEAEDLLHKLE